MINDLITWILTPSLKYPYSIWINLFHCLHYSFTGSIELNFSYCLALMEWVHRVIISYSKEVSLPTPNQVFQKRHEGPYRCNQRIQAQCHILSSFLKSFSVKPLVEYTKNQDYGLPILLDYSSPTMQGMQGRQ